MKYIAIKNNSFLIIDSTMNESSLLADGFILYTEGEYLVYVAEKSLKTISETMNDLEVKAEEYIVFGSETWETVKKKVFAINTYNKSQGLVLSIEQMKTLLSTSDMLEKTLKTGSFDTAKDVASYLKIILPQYSVVSDYIILELNTFMGVV